MSLLLSIRNISKFFGSRQLFQELSFGVFLNDKIGLIGPNGSGKSTLLKILAGLESADEGNVIKNQSIRVGYIPQETLFPNVSLKEILLNAFSKSDHLSQVEKETKVSIILSKFGFADIHVKADSLSGGWQKRLAIACELVLEPDLLLLDEPTNHLDLEGVLWLENFLINSTFAFIVISHDRYFLEHSTNKMMELDKTYPKGIFLADGSYSYFLEKKEEFLSGQLQQERSLNSKVRREVEWLKQNPKARTTKSTSRIQEAHRLIGELNDLKVRHQSDSSQIQFSSSKKESQKLMAITNLSKIMGEKELFSEIQLILSPGTRLGVVGLNGSGKTTFLKLLAGELIPDKGSIKKADGIKVVYFDQHRVQIPDDSTLRRALVGQEGDTVIYRGQSIHVNSWCKRFLFTPDRLDLPFKYLSGGEKARVHIARLMLQSADVLLLDEPTNDLDIGTLEVLEQSLKEFPGAIVIISHDRYMLDQICNVFLGLGTESDSELFADYRQWEQFQANKQQEKKKNSNKEDDSKKNVPVVQERVKKLSFNEKRELEQMEGKILAIEEEISKLQAQILVTKDPLELQKFYQSMNQKQTIHDQLYHRWQELEMLSK